MIWNIIEILVGGTIIGYLGKLVAPGDRDKVPAWLVIICGILGAFVGSLIYYQLFGVAGNVKGNSDYGAWNTTKGIDWWRHLWQIAAAAVLVVVAAGVTGRKKVG